MGSLHSATDSFYLGICLGVPFLLLIAVIVGILNLVPRHPFLALLAFALLIAALGLLALTAETFVPLWFGILFGSATS